MHRVLPRVVLVRPRGGANVGSVCRAMMNMGAQELVVVDGRFDPEEAARMAVHARSILERRRDVSTLTDAVAGCSTVVGTSARKGPHRDRGRDVRELAAELAGAERAGAAPAALVFGPEDTGLTNDDLARCHHLAFIPTSEAYPSLNLSQAVMVVLYEIHRARLADTAGWGGGPRRAAPRALADAGEVEQMFVGLERVLVDVGFLPSDNPGHIMAALRALLGRAGLDERELRILRGLVRQIGWYVRGGRDVALAKRERGEKLK